MVNSKKISTSVKKYKETQKTKDGKLEYNLYDPEGNMVGKTYVDRDVDMSNSKGRFFTKNDDGSWTMYDSKNPAKATVSLDKNTGKITVSVPNIALKNENFKTNLGATLKRVSEAYKSNPDYKFTYTDEDGTNKEKTIQEVIDEFNAPMQNDDGSLNQNSISYIATAAMELELKKEAFKKASGFDFTDEEIMMAEPAAGPEVKDNAPQLISDLPEAAWLRNVSTYNKETGYAQRGDIMENAYNKEKTSSEDMIRLWAALEDYFSRGNFTDKEEYIKNVATVRFLDATQPNMAWIRDVTENVNGFLNGILSIGPELWTTTQVGIENLFGSIFGLTKEYYDTYGTDFSNVYITRGGNQFATDMPFELVDGKIGKVKIDEYGVPKYVEEKIEGAIEEPKTVGQMLRTVYKENQAVIKKDIEYLHASQNGWDAVGYLIATLAATVAAGNRLSDIFTVGAGYLTSVATRHIGVTIESLADTMTSFYAGGSALGFGSTPEEVGQLISGIRTIYDVAAVTGKSAQFMNFIGKAVASAKATELIIGVVGESLAEAVVGDTNRFIEVLTNEDIDTDTKNYLIETYIMNALGWGIGLGLSKFLIGAGETTKGRAISANFSRRLFKIQNAVGDAFDRSILTIRRVEGDTLADKIINLYDNGGKYAKKQANSLAATQILRRIRDVISESPSIKIRGKTNEEIETALKDIEKKIFELQNAEVALNSMQRQGMDIVQGWLKDKGAGIKEAAENFYKKASEVSKLEKISGGMFSPVKGSVTDLTSGKTIRLFSQTTTNYIKATEKIDFINA